MIDHCVSILHFLFNSMGSWYMSLSVYMDGRCFGKFNSMGGGVEIKVPVTGKEFFSMRQWPFIIQNQCDILKTNVTFFLLESTQIRQKKYIILDIEPWPNFQPIILYFPSFLSLMTRLLRRRW